MMSTHSGSVVAFSVEAGSGQILDSKTSREVFFHATQLADGTRTISVGTSVDFDVVPGGRGRYEAVRVRVAAGTADSAKPEVFRCPVCGAPVDGEARAYEICDTCGWEDDPVQYDDPSSTGANAESLNDARTSWKRSERSS
jgi:cold shock CspA family protein